MYQTDNYHLFQMSSLSITDEYLSALNDNEINKYTDRYNFQTTHDDAAKYLNSHFVLGIYNKLNRRHVGNIGIDRIDNINRSCEIGLLIWDRGIGIGSECLPVVVDHCFNRLNMQRVWMGTLASNAAMNKLALKCGFHHEGTQRRARILNNKYEDVMTYVKFCD